MLLTPSLQFILGEVLRSVFAKIIMASVDHQSPSSPSESDTAMNMGLTIYHSGVSHSFTLPQTATVEDLASSAASSINIPIENQKFLIAPRPGLLKPPFPQTRLDSLLQPDSPRFKITLLGSASKDIENLKAQGAEAKRKADSRASALATASTRSAARRTAGGVHTLSSSSSSNNSTFHRLLPLNHLPNPAKSMAFLARLRDDPGIRSAMAKHRFSVPLLTEMDPAEHTTMSSRTLGLNRNRGEVIELRLRTDAYDGYRDYRTIRKTLCHELAHCVFGEHDSDFWALTRQIEKEVEAADYLANGRRLTDQEFYDPGDWERSSHEEHFDERGWTGGEYVLGGSVGGKNGGAESRREVLARAAEERMRQERQNQQ